jgi:hypothetical protein
MVNNQIDIIINVSGTSLFYFNTIPNISKIKSKIMRLNFFVFKIIMKLTFFVFKLIIYINFNYECQPKSNTEIQKS